MARTSNNFSIFAEVQLDTSTIQKQLNDASKGKVFNFDDKQVKTASTSFKDLGDSVKKSQSNIEDFDLSFQAANEVLSKSIKVIASMVDQVFALDGALTE